MLQVKKPEEVMEIIRGKFRPLERIPETASLRDSYGRILGADVAGTEYVPGFDRSTVDGYAVRASDTFGCTESIPVILSLQEKILMGRSPEKALGKDCCSYVPTGGELPGNADSVIMQEYAEEFGDGTVGFSKCAAPGDNIIRKGDDVFPGRKILKKGQRLSSREIGVLASLGITEVPVLPRFQIGILSTGDELIPPEENPSAGRIRDINASMLSALFTGWGAAVRFYGILPDDEQILHETMAKALEECDAVVVSGGSSAGEKDNCSRCIESLGELLLHGIAIKPGKPTIIGRSGEKPLIGLPGHPGAAWFMAKMFILPLLDRLAGIEKRVFPVTAALTENVAANHGRAYLCACALEQSGDMLLAHPVRSKSGLITSLADTDGYFCISRDCEGYAKGSEIKVYIYEDR